MEVMKKYIAFRIVTAWVKNHKVVKGFFALGQKDTDYNWDFLGEFDNMETAKKYIKSVRTDANRQIAYTPDGYAFSF